MGCRVLQEHTPSAVIPVKEIPALILEVEEGLQDLVCGQMKLLSLEGMPWATLNGAQQEVYKCKLLCGVVADYSLNLRLLLGFEHPQG